MCFFVRCLLSTSPKALAFHLLLLGLPCLGARFSIPVSCCFCRIVLSFLLVGLSPNAHRPWAGRSTRRRRRNSERVRRRRWRAGKMPGDLLLRESRQPSCAWRREARTSAGRTSPSTVYTYSQLFPVSKLRENCCLSPCSYRRIPPACLDLEVGRPCEL